MILLAILGLNSFNQFLAFPKQIKALPIMNDSAASDEVKTKARKTFGAFHGMSMLANMASLGLCLAYFYQITAGLSEKW